MIDEFSVTHFLSTLVCKRILHLYYFLFLFMFLITFRFLFRHSLLHIFLHFFLSTHSAQTWNHYVYIHMLYVTLAMQWNMFELKIVEILQELLVILNVAWQRYFSNILIFFSFLLRCVQSPNWKIFVLIG